MQVVSRQDGPSPRGVSIWRWLATALRISNVRLRFFLILLALFLVVGQWDTLWNYWEKLSRNAFGHKQSPQAVSSGIEYWCPMCPGVVSDWPAKCPVCNMTLVQRQKHEMVPLPDGIVSRMQMSPYRIQLAGIRTSTVTYQPLVQETTTGGYVDEDGSVTAEIFDRDLSFIHEGQPVTASCDALPSGSLVPGRVQTVKARHVGGHWRFQMRLALDDPNREFKAGMFVTVRLRVPPDQWSWYTRTLMDNWRDEMAADLLTNSLFAPVQPATGAGLESLGRMALQQIMLHQGLVPAIPESAVVDTGRQKLVFLESEPGMFDGVEVVLGPRCGSFYPLIRGPEVNQPVVTVGAFLIDAEARLNPAAASLYFGSGSNEGREITAAERENSSLATRSNKEDRKIQAARAKLNPEDLRLVEAQEFCPILEKNRLGSMGKPFKVMINDQPVFLCCEGCQEEAVAHPSETLAKVEQLKRRLQAAAKGK